MPEIVEGLQGGVLRMGTTDVQMSPWPLPVIYFEEAPSLSHLNGIIGITLAVGANVPGPNQTVLGVASVVAYLKCNIPAALALKGALDAALLLAQPAGNQSEKPS